MLKFQKYDKLTKKMKRHQPFQKIRNSISHLPTKFSSDVDSSVKRVKTGKSIHIKGY